MALGERKSQKSRQVRGSDGEKKKAGGDGRESRPILGTTASRAVKNNAIEETERSKVKLIGRKAIRQRDKRRIFFGTGKGGP